MQKALRMVDPGVKGFEPRGPTLTHEQMMTEFQKPTDKRVFAIAQALETGEVSPMDITMNTCIDPWFIARLKLISDFRQLLRGKELHQMDKETMVQAKKYGLSDPQIASLVKVNGAAATEDAVRLHRVNTLGVTPFVKQVRRAPLFSSLFFPLGRHISTDRSLTSASTLSSSPRRSTRWRPSTRRRPTTST